MLNTKWSHFLVCITSIDVHETIHIITFAKIQMLRISNKKAMLSMICISYPLNDILLAPYGFLYKTNLLFQSCTLVINYWQQFYMSWFITKKLNHKTCRINMSLTKYIIRAILVIWCQHLTTPFSSDFVWFEYSMQFANKGFNFGHKHYTATCVSNTQCVWEACHSTTLVNIALQMLLGKIQISTSLLSVDWEVWVQLLIGTFIPYNREYKPSQI